MAAGNAEVDVPPTLKALLAARLDQLDEAERKVLERGAVEGEIFHRGAVQALAPEETQVTTRLAGLVRRELIRPDRAQLAGDDGYRFRHLLIRDAAYDALPKAIRADLHARFAAWLDEHGQALVELDEIVGYHLEQAARYQAELGRPDPALAERAAAAARRRRPARERPPRRAGPRSRSSPGRSSSCARSGSTSRSSSRPHGRTRRSTVARPHRQRTRSPNVPRPRATAPARCSRARWPSSCARTAATLLVTDEQEELCRAALPFEEERGDPRRLALLWDVARPRRAVPDAERRLRRRLRAGSPLPPPRRRLPLRHAGIDWSLILGPRPADEGLRMLDELAAGRPPGAADLGRAVLLAMLGRIDEAWPLAEARSDHLREVGGGSFTGDEYLAAIAMIEGDRQRACRHHAELIDALPPGSEGVAATYRLLLARDLCYLGRFDEAEPLLRQVAGRSGRARSSGRWAAAVEALLLAARGEFEQAEALARAGVAAAETETDNGLAPGLGLRGPRHRARARRPDRRGARGARARPRALGAEALPALRAPSP